MADGEGVQIRKRHKNRPLESKWRQQSLPAYRPVFNASTVLPWTTITGILFVGIGILLYVTTLKAKEVSVDYTNCRIPNGTSAAHVVLQSADNNSCVYRIALEEDINGTVKFFYGLSGFYQNSRLYVKSRSDLQLAGDLEQLGDCDPLAEREVESEEGNVSLPIAPCGKMADSMFNDTFHLSYDANGTDVPVPWTTRGMLHEWEQERKFKNPRAKPGESLCDVFKDTVRPPSWSLDICQLGDDETGRGFENVDFQVWMKPAALPKFRKIYRILDRQADVFEHGLPAGNYTLTIKYQYPVESLSINKTFVLAVESWAGPRNVFLSSAYIAVGGLLLLLSAVLFALHLRLRYKSD